MYMNYQDLTLTKLRTAKLYSQNPNRSLSATFRNLRKKSNNSFIGDYPVLFAILEVVVELRIPVTRFQLNHTLNQSWELKQFSKGEKTGLLNQLFKQQHVQKKIIKNSLGLAEIKKLNSLSL